MAGPAVPNGPSQPHWSRGVSKAVSRRLWNPYAIRGQVRRGVWACSNEAAEDRRPFPTAACGRRPYGRRGNHTKRTHSRTYRLYPYRRIWWETNIASSGRILKGRITAWLIRGHLPFRG